MLPSAKILSTSSDHTSLPSLRSLWCLRLGVRDLWKDASVMYFSRSRDLGRDKGDGETDEEQWTRTRRDITSNPMKRMEGVNSVCTGRTQYGKTKEKSEGKKRASDVKPLYMKRGCGPCSDAYYESDGTI